MDMPPNTVYVVCFKEMLDSENGLECDGSGKRLFYRDYTKTPKSEFTNILLATPIINGFDATDSIVGQVLRALLISYSKHELANLSNQITF